MNREIALCALLALSGCLGGGDDDDDADSDKCIAVREKYSKAKRLRDEAVSLGAPVGDVDAALDDLVNKNWSCFR